MPLWSYDGQRVSLWYFSAGYRYTALGTVCMTHESHHAFVRSSRKDGVRNMSRNHPHPALNTPYHQQHWQEKLLDFLGLIWACLVLMCTSLDLKSRRHTSTDTLPHYLSMVCRDVWGASLLPVVKFDGAFSPIRSKTAMAE